MFTGGGPEDDDAELGDEVGYTLTTSGWRWVDNTDVEQRVLERERQRREGRHAAARLWALIVRELQKVPIKWG